MTAGKEYKAVSWISHNLGHILPTDMYGYREIPWKKERLDFIFHCFANTSISENRSQNASSVFLLNSIVTNYNSLSY